MCGLTGFFQPGGFQAEEGAAVAEAMARRIAHRGPDDAGVWVDAPAGIALAHRRLSILDLSPAGHQPMVSASGRYVLAFNGELYNHGAWRCELEAAGARWQGASDTETLLAGIETWGLEAALVRTVGMFAFALWDRATASLTLARDRLGEKPLYYGWQRGTLLFGSELRALRAHPAFQAPVDRGALALLLRFGAIPAPCSIHEGVHKLLPGAWVTLSARTPEAAPRRWWDLRQVIETGRAQPFTGTPDEAVDTLERLLGDSVAQQMVADVPLGAFLSGGVDSSTIVSLMQARSSRPVRTFTIGFDDAAHDESQHARAVARHLGTAHTELRLSAREALDVIPSLPAHYCEPLADPSAVPTLLVSRLARSQVTVSLSGDAGDELFGGYRRYLSARALWRPWARMSPAARAAGAGMLRHMQPEAWGGLAMALPPGWRAPARALPALGDRLHKAAGVFEAADSADFYRRVMSQWPDPAALVAGAVEPATLPGDAHWPPPWQRQSDGFVQQMMATDLLAYLPDHVLAKVDRAAMSAGLETRVPLLSPAVVEFAWSLPLHYKLRGGTGKWVLRRVLSRHVPEALFERPKQGFGVPLGSWLRGPLRPWAQALLEPARLAREGYLDRAAIGRKWSEHLSGRHDWGFPLWNVLMFQAWLEQHGPATPRARA
jgi:asparagine synthase (glutamine-hydrolysing)